jgi:transposase
MEMPLDLSADELAATLAAAPPGVALLLETLLLRNVQLELLVAQQQHTIEQQQHTIEQQQQNIAALTARVQQLSDQLSRTSHNSHQPPASDGFNKKPRSLRQRSGKQPGGQAGHPGQTLRFSDQPHDTVAHHPSRCSDCGADLTAVAPSTIQRRQVVDLPPLQLRTTEHQVASVCCPNCQCLTSAAFPPEVSESVQYGPRIKALALYLRCYQLLPSARTAQLLTDLFGNAPSEGTLDNLVQQAAGTLAPLVEHIRAALTAAPVAHFDETGCYVEDKRWWLHVAATDKLTYYFVHRQRGYGGSKAAGVLPGFGGTAIHDGYAPYWKYECLHALCNAHILRELQFVVERSQQQWAAELASLLRHMLAATTAARDGGAAALDAAQIAEFAARYEALVAAGLAENPVRERPAEQPQGKVGQSKATNLLLRLREHAAEVLRFVRDLTVPFDNNQAERDIRMMKVQQKISGRFRTAHGAAAFCCIRSYISTLRKQEQSILPALEQTFRGTPLLPSSLG